MLVITSKFHIAQETDPVLGVIQRIANFNLKDFVSRFESKSAEMDIVRKYSDLIDIVEMERKAALSSIIGKRGKDYTQGDAMISPDVNQKSKNAIKKKFNRDVADLRKQCDADIRALHGVEKKQSRKERKAPREIVHSRKSRVIVNDDDTPAVVPRAKKIQLSNTGNLIVDLRQNRSRREEYVQRKKDQDAFFRRKDRIVAERRRNSVEFDQDVYMPRVVREDTISRMIRLYPIVVSELEELKVNVGDNEILINRIISQHEGRDELVLQDIIDESIIAISDIESQDTSHIDEFTIEEKRPLSEREILNNNAFFKAVASGRSKFHWINSSGKKIEKKVEGYEKFIARQNERAEAKWKASKEEAHIGVMLTECKVCDVVEETLRLAYCVPRIDWCDFCLSDISLCIRDDCPLGDHDLCFCFAKHPFMGFEFPVITCPESGRWEAGDDLHDLHFRTEGLIGDEKYDTFGDPVMSVHSDDPLPMFQGDQYTFLEIEERLQKYGIVPDPEFKWNEELLESEEEIVPETLWDRIKSPLLDVKSFDFAAFIDEWFFDPLQHLANCINPKYVEIVKSVLSLVMRTAQIVFCQTPYNVGLVVSQFVMEYASVRGLKSIMHDLIGLMNRMFVTEGLSDTIKTVHDFVMQIVSTPIATAMHCIVTSVVASRICPFVDMSVWKKYFGKVQSMPLIDVFCSIIESLPNIIGAFESWWDGSKTIPEIFLEEDPVSAFLSETRRIKHYSDKTYSGLPVDGKVCLEVLAKETNECLDSGRALKSTIGRFDQRKRSVEEGICTLENIKLQLQDQLDFPRRTPPIAFVIYGAPGIGKSNLVEWLCRIYCEVTGINYNQYMLFSKPRTSDYWDQYDPLSQLFIHLSEMGNEHKQLAQAAKNDNLIELNSLVDSLPFSCDMAECDKKNRVKAKPKLVIVDTNNRDMWISEQFGKMSGAAMYRRFIFLDITVKPEFRAKGTTALDAEKSLAAGGNILDRVHIALTTYRANVDKKVEKIHFTGKDIVFATTYIASMIQRHIEVNNDVERALDYSFIKAAVTAPLVNEVDFGWVNEEMKEPAKIDPFDYDAINAAFDEISSMYCIEEEKTGLIVEGLSEWFKPEGQMNIVAGKFVYRDDATGSFVYPSRIMLGKYYAQKFFEVLIVLIEALFLLTFEVFFSRFYGVDLLRIVMVFTLFFSYRLVFIVLFFTFLFHDRVEEYARFCIAAYGVRQDIMSLKNYVQKKRDYLNPLINYKMAITVAGLTAFALACKKISTFMKAAYNTEALQKSSFSEEVDAHELKSGTNLFVQPVRMKGDTVWANKADLSVREIPAFAGSPKIFGDLVRSQVRYVKVVGIDWFTYTHILLVKGTMAIINGHALGGERRVNVLMYHSFYNADERSTQLLIDLDHNAYDCGNDVVLFDTFKTTSKDITAHFSNEEFKGKRGFVKDLPIRVSSVVKRLDILDKRTNANIRLNQVLEYNLEDHEAGMCGIPVICELLDNKFSIVGIHSGGSVGSAVCAGSWITRNNLRHYIHELESKSKFVKVLAESGIPFPRIVPSGPSKSMFLYESVKYVDYRGVRTGFVLAKGKSKIVKTRNGLSDIFCDVMEYKCDKLFGVPMMEAKRIDGVYYNPHNIYLRKMDKDSPAVDLALMERVIDEFTARIVSGLRSRGVENFSPITLLEAINGVEGDPFISRVNASTSAGFGLKGKKSDHLILQSDDVTRIPDKELLSQLVDIIRLYNNGEMAHPITKVALKDEVRELSKCLNGSTRPFYMTPTAFLLMCRAYLSPFFAFMVQHSDVFCVGVGMNMHKDSDMMMKNSREFSENFLEGDYSGFDVSNSVFVARAANTVIHRVLEEFGYNEYSLNVVDGILSDWNFPFLEDLNDIFMKPGMQPSGKYATAEDNSLRGILMIMYAYYSVPGNENKNVFDWLYPTVYGDDYIIASKDSEFTNDVFADQILSCFGMTCTPACKNGEFKPFLRWDEVSFLKRQFVWSNEFERYIAPLEMSSIYKSLDWIMPSNSVTEEEQVEGTLRSALTEVFFHCEGDEKFVRLREEFMRQFQCYYGRMPYNLPTYESLVESLGF